MSLSLFFLHPSQPPHEHELHKEHEVLHVKYGQQVASQHIEDIPPHSVVIPRHTPISTALEANVIESQSRLLNSYDEHCAITDQSTWQHLIEFNPEKVRYVPRTAQTVKNSTQDAPSQHRFPHLRRAFVYQGEVLSWGYAGAAARDPFGIQALDGAQFYQTMHTVIDNIAQLAPFCSIDMIEHHDGAWGVVAIRDGCMTPLDGNDPAKVWIPVAERCDAILSVM